MKKQGLSQEGLKLIACIAMLLDHLAVVVVMGPVISTRHGIRLEIYEFLRLIGRLSFPIYCFLLAEGSARTRNPVRYGLRLAVCCLLSEFPYDLTLWGGFSWRHQNVMVTLLLGFCALEAMKKSSNVWVKLLLVLPFALAADLAHSDYGAKGVLLIALFSLTREMPYRYWIQLLGMWFLFSPGNGMFLNWREGIRITTQEWAVLALIPISFYSGRKATSHKLIQWGFYLFYPVHLLALYFIGRL